MAKIDNGTMWSCSDGHNTVYNNGRIEVRDIYATVLFTRPLTPELRELLEGGECPICDGFLCVD